MLDALAAGEANGCAARWRARRSTGGTRNDRYIGYRRGPRPEVDGWNNERIKAQLSQGASAATVAEITLATLSNAPKCRLGIPPGRNPGKPNWASTVATQRLAQSY